MTRHLRFPEQSGQPPPVPSLPQEHLALPQDFIAIRGGVYFFSPSFARLAEFHILIEV